MSDASKELIFAIGQLLESLPASHDWFNPDAERTLRAYLTEAKDHGSSPLEDDILTMVRRYFFNSFSPTERIKLEYTLKEKLEAIPERGVAVAAQAPYALKWIALAEQMPMTSGKILVTNMIHSRNAQGNMSHVWLVDNVHEWLPGQKTVNGKEGLHVYGRFSAFTDIDVRLHGLTHWADPFAAGGPSVVTSDVRRNADRYEWLRSQNWDESSVAVVQHPKVNVRLGARCPSGDLLDDLIDAEIAGAQS